MDRAIEQLELALEDIEAAEAQAGPPVLASTASAAKAKPSRHTYSVDRAVEAFDLAGDRSQAIKVQIDFGA